MSQNSSAPRPPGAHGNALPDGDASSAEIVAALREGQRQLASLLRSLPGMAFRRCNDANWTLEFASEGSVALTGYPPEDLTASRRVNYADLILSEDRPGVLDSVQAAAQGNQPYVLTYRIRAAQGSVKWVREHGRPVLNNTGQLLALEGFITDITEQKRAEEELAQERELMRALMENVPDSIYFKDVSSRFLMVNRYKAARLGFERPDDAVGRSDADFLPEATAEQLLAEERRIFETGRPVIGKVERQSAPGEPEVWALVTKVPFRGPDGRIQGMVGVSRDITELRNLARRLTEANVRLEELARTDGLTGLLNRRVILEMAEAEWTRWERYGGDLSVLVVDTDDFKQVNDRHGHLVGDRALRLLAERIQAALRSVDVVGRYGGEEFLVLLPETGAEGATTVGRKLVQTIAETPLRTEGADVPLTVSVGGACVLPKDLNLDALIQRADEALYLAKRRGKNQFILHGNGEASLFES